jgi:YD repeat-containing protein
MKQMAFSKVLTVVTCALMLCVSVPTLAVADQAKYFYDALGRLSAVVDGQGNTAFYQYDAVGNLLSISRGTATAPTITSVVPSTITAGQGTPVTITGTGLLGATLSSSNPQMTFSAVTVVSNTTVTATLTLPNPTTFDSNTLLLNAVGGTASTAITVQQPTPVISTISPTRGLPGTILTITGTGLSLQRAAITVTFAGLNGTRVAGEVLSAKAVGIKVTVPVGAVTGPVTITINNANTSDGVNFQVVSLAAFASVAQQGTMRNAALASANVGRTVTIQGSGFSSQTVLLFPSRFANGTPAPPIHTIITGISGQDASLAQVLIPTGAVTGAVILQESGFGTASGGPILQIVPVVDSINTLTGVAPDRIQLMSRGANPSGTLVHVPGVPTAVPVSTFSSDGQTLELAKPAGFAPGLLTLETDGGTSNIFSVPGLSTLTTVAQRGTPTDIAVASANAGQQVIVQGTFLTPSLPVRFPTVSEFQGPGGAAGFAFPILFDVNAAGTSGQAFVPPTSTTGIVSVNGVGSAPLQIVPDLTTFAADVTTPFGPGTELTLSGSGFHESEASVLFPGIALPVPPDDVYSLNFSGANDRLKVTVPSGTMAGTLAVRTNGGTSPTLTIPGLTALVATATQGTPAVPGSPSANVNQAIQLQGIGFRAGSQLRFITTDQAGVAGVSLAFLQTASADGTSGTAFVPASVTTGNLTIAGPGSAPLQIVPTVTAANVAPGTVFAPGTILTISGSGFKEGATNVSFSGAAAAVPATDVFSDGNGNNRLTVIIPPGANGLSYAVVTDGGTSATRQFGALQSITASAPRGTPQSPGQPSANVGQFITLQGVGFGTGSQAIFTSTNDTGVAGFVAASLINVNVAGTSANVIVPATATSGPVSADGQGNVALQIVPTVFALTLPPGQSFTPGVVATLGGTGFKEGATTVTFSGASPVAASDVTANNSRLTVTIPSGAVVGTVTVTADGNVGVFDTTRPSVRLVLPNNGQQNAPLNTRIAVLFDEPVQPATVSTTSLSVAGPSGFVPSTVTLSSDQQTAIITPTQPLEATHGYAVSFLSSITDLAGNALNPGATTFSTGMLSDTTAPTVTSTSPLSGATLVPTNAVIRVYFSESLLNTTVTSQTIALSAGGVPVPATMTLEQNNTVLRVQPSGPLQANTVYTISVAPTVEDLSGNPFGAQFTSSFNTGAGADTLAPTIGTRTPADGATNLPSDTMIVVAFSEPIEPATVNSTTTFTLTGGGINGTIPGVFSFSADRQTVTFTPEFPLFAGQTFFVTLLDIEDSSGNRLANTTSSFSTQGGGSGGVVPAFATVIPASNALFANGQTLTRVTIDNIADSNGFLVPDGTQIAVTAAPAFQQTSAGGTILGGTTSVADSRFKILTTTNGRVRFDYKSPAVVLAPGFSAEGIIQVASVTATGIPISLIGENPVTLVTSQTASITFNPQTLLPNGTSQAEVTVVVRDPVNTLDDFGRPIPAGTVMGVGVLSAQGPLGTINGGTAAPDPRYKLFSAKTGGIIDLTYTAPNLVQGPTDGNSEEFSAVPVDPAGNLLGAFGSSVIGLVTGGCDAGGECVPGGFTGPLPKLLTLSPSLGEDNVGTTAPIMAQFSQSIDPASVTALTFSVSSGGTPILGTYALSAGLRGPNTIVTFTPTAPWTPGTVIDVALTTGIRNSAGNPLLTSVFDSFSIGAGPDNTGPSVIGASLGNGLTNVPHSAVINVLFSQPVNPAMLNTNTFTVLAGGTPISGRISLSNSGLGVNTLATFVQDQLLASDTVYTISLTSGVTDSSGNPLTPSFTSTFRTAAGTPITDVGEPSVDSIMPADDQQQVPLNPTVAVQMDKAINRLTVGPGSFGLSTSQVTVEGTTTFTTDQKSWTFTPTAPLEPTTQHFVDVTNGLRDIAGNRLSFSGLQTTFYTGTSLASPTGPQVTSVTPPNNATNVFLNQPITIRFSEPLVPATVTAQTVFVSRGGVPVSGVLTLLDDNKAIRWVPANGGTLSSNVLHTITVTIGVTGLASNPLSAQLTFSFTTGTATDTAAPAVTSITPLDGAQEVPRNQQIEVIVNEPIDPGSAQAGFFLEHNDSGTEIDGALTLSQDRTTIQFVPTFPLLAGQTFNLYLDEIADSVGNQMAFVSSSFTTAVAPGTDLGALPDSASIFIDNNFLPADGQATTTVTITDITRGGVPVPDGTTIGVTAARMFDSSVGGTILGGTPSGADSRVSLFTVTGGSVTLTYQAPLLSVVNGEARIQVLSVDAVGAPMQRIGVDNVFFEGGGGQ